MSQIRVGMESTRKTPNHTGLEQIHRRGTEHPTDISQENINLYM